MAVIAVVALMMATSVGCRRRGVARDGRLSARYQASLMEHAARATGCSPAQLSPSMISQSPNVYTVSGCASPVEFWLQCRRRSCAWVDVPTLSSQAAAVLSCAPQMVQQQPTQAPNMRFATGCGRSASFVITCNGAACGWAASGPVQGVAAGAPDPQQHQQASLPQPQAPVPPARLQAEVQTQREAILSCVDVTSLEITLRWTADGQLVITLPTDMAGTAAEGCVQAAVGTLHVAAQQAGEIVVPVQ